MADVNEVESMDDEEDEQCQKHWLPDTIENLGCCLVTVLFVLLLFSTQVVAIIHALRGGQ